MKVTVSKIENH